MSSRRSVSSTSRFKTGSDELEKHWTERAERAERADIWKYTPTEYIPPEYKKTGKSSVASQAKHRADTHGHHRANRFGDDSSTPRNIMLFDTNATESDEIAVPKRIVDGALVKDFASNPLVLLRQLLRGSIDSASKLLCWNYASGIVNYLAANSSMKLAFDIPDRVMVVFEKEQINVCHAADTLELYRCVLILLVELHQGFSDRHDVIAICGCISGICQYITIFGSHHDIDFTNADLAARLSAMVVVV